MTITILKKAVFDEVAQTTAYAGAKMGAYEAVSTTDADESQLLRFWAESCDSIVQAFRGLITSETHTPESLALDLALSAAFDNSQLQSMHSALGNYCVHSIVAKWFGLANKAEAPVYASSAASLLQEARRQACLKKKPTRPRF